MAFPLYGFLYNLLAPHFVKKLFYIDYIELAYPQNASSDAVQYYLALCKYAYIVCIAMASHLCVFLYD